MSFFPSFPVHDCQRNNGNKSKKQREETELLLAEEHLKLREREQLVHYVATDAGHSTHSTHTRPLDQRYQNALEQLAVQKQKLYDEIDRVSLLENRTRWARESFRTDVTVPTIRRVARHETKIEGKTRKTKILSRPFAIVDYGKL